jgi:prepilin-type N-terminal cleavage/methylation domain-containing protein
MAGVTRFNLVVRQARTRNGFTLVELMFVVAVIGVLAAVAVNVFSQQTRKVRGSETQAMLAAFRFAQEQYYLENGRYLSTGAEASTWPTTPTKEKQTLLPLPALWTTLKVRTPETSAFCGYVTIAGTAGSATGIGTKANEFGLIAAPSSDWYYVLAHCDLDGSATRDSYYFTSSLYTTIQKQNEGS